MILRFFPTQSPELQGSARWELHALGPGSVGRDSERAAGSDAHTRASCLDSGSYWHWEAAQSQLPSSQLLLE